MRELLCSMDGVLRAACGHLGFTYREYRYTPNDGLVMDCTDPDGARREMRVYQIKRNDLCWTVWLTDPDTEENVPTRRIPQDMYPDVAVIVESDNAVTCAVPYTGE